MTDTMFDACFAVARAMGILKMGTADSSGSTTTLVDSNIGGDDDDWNGGTLWHIDDGEYSEISDYVESTGAITILDELSAATESGDRYAISDKEYPLDAIQNAVNDVLTSIRYPKVDTSTISISANQSEYTLPSDCHDLRQVYFQTQDDDNEHDWVPFNNFDVEKTATGSADTLILNHHEITAGYSVKLVYVGWHSALYSATSQIDESIDIRRIVPGAVVNLIYRNLQDMNKASESIDKFIDRWERRAEFARIRFPIRLPPKMGKITALGSD